MANETNEPMEGDVRGHDGADYSFQQRDEGAGVKEKAQRLAGQAKQEVGEQLKSGFQSGKEQASNAIGGVARALLQAGEQDQGAATQYIRRAGEQMQHFGDYLRNTDLNNLVARTEGLARRQPALFLGGAFMLGIISARFIKSGRRPLGLHNERSQAEIGYSSRGHEPHVSRIHDQERPVANAREETTHGMQADPLTHQFNAPPGRSDFDDAERVERMGDSAEGFEPRAEWSRRSPAEDAVDLNPTGGDDTLSTGRPGDMPITKKGQP